jgi:hypothetical protein
LGTLAVCEYSGELKVDLSGKILASGTGLLLVCQVTIFTLVPMLSQTLK